jgi:hypothetical protein
MQVIRNILNKAKERAFLRKSFDKVERNAFFTPGNLARPLFIISVTYNNDSLIAHQANLIKKNISDPVFFIVADNSTKPEKRKSIRNYCDANGIGYISLPENPYQSCSRSHSICLNWIYRNFIMEFNPKYFGFVDHDIYPVRKHSIIEILRRQKMYGHLQGKEYWYLWPGLCFYETESCKNFELDFSPDEINGVKSDTGGANYEKLYRHIDKEKIIFPPHQYVSLREGDVVQSDKMEMIGDWLHSFNGSYWMDVKPKENELDKYLEKFY